MNKVQMYKVFFNEQIIFIASIKDAVSMPSAVQINNNDSLKPHLLTFFEKEDDLYLISENPDEVFENLKQEFNYLEAAGGLVKNEDDEFLFIYRLDHWDLPKGKIEINETPEEAAYREISEECGIVSHQLKSHLCETYHIYQQNKNMLLKKTYWFYFEQSDANEITSPQTEESIERVSWFEDVEIELALLESYPSIEDVIEAYQDKIL